MHLPDRRITVVFSRTALDTEVSSCRVNLLIVLRFGKQNQVHKEKGQYWGFLPDRPSVLTCACSISSLKMLLIETTQHPSFLS